MGTNVSDWKSYKRYPIRMSNQTIALLHLFTNTGHMSDIWAWEKEDEAEYEANNGDLYAQAAAQFRKQLEGQDCVAFWMALKAEAEKVIAEWETMKANIPAEAKALVDGINKQ